MHIRIKNIKRNKMFDQYITVDTVGLTNGTTWPAYNTNGTIGTNDSTNGTIGTVPMVPLAAEKRSDRVLWLPTVPMATNCTIGKFSNDTIGRTLNVANLLSLTNGTIGTNVSLNGTVGSTVGTNDTIGC